MRNSRPRRFFGGTGFPACAGAGEGACSAFRLDVRILADHMYRIFRILQESNLFQHPVSPGGFSGKKIPGGDGLNFLIIMK
jgi:hypothetical protein